MRLIDADAFVEAIKKDLRKYPEDDLIYPVMEWFLDNIKSRPTTEQPTWISCAERLPTKADANPYDSVIAIQKDDGFARSWIWDIVERYPQEFTHWMPLPQPPKGDE